MKDGKIPDDFHKNSGNTLCLGISLEIEDKFINHPDLLGFIDYLLIPYLYSYSHFIKYNFMPYGEFSHGIPGVLKFYREKLNVVDDIRVINLLKILAEDNYRGHPHCPCVSFLNLRKCHGPMLLKLKKQRSKNYYFWEYLNLILHLFQKGNNVPKELISRKLKNDFRKIKKKAKNNKTNPS